MIDFLLPGTLYRPCRKYSLRMKTAVIIKEALYSWPEWYRLVSVKRLCSSSGGGGVLFCFAVFS